MTRLARQKVVKEVPELMSYQTEAIKEFFPEAFSDDRIDFEKLRGLLGDSVLQAGAERFSFSWAGKRNAIQILQMPTRATLVPDKKESVNFETTENLFIEGDNLEVLKLLYKPYFGRIKMIYIDPPYNTGKEFVYPDNYSDPLEAYLAMTKQKDAAGNLLTTNIETSGRFHSAWLSMMYPRLFLAKQLLHEEGVIFVSIDDNEVHHLRMIMDELFGYESFIAQFVWKSRQNKDNRNVTGASIDHEYVLCYGRRIRGSERKMNLYSNPDNDPRGPWTSANMVGILPEELRPNCHYDLIDPKTKINYGKPKMGWRYEKKAMNKLIAQNKIIWPKSPSGRPRRKLFLSELKQKFTGFSSIIGDGIYTKDGTGEIEEIFGARVIEYPKPSELIKQLIIQGTDKDDIILDFFAGSCPTAQAVLEQNREDDGNRRFIMVQLPEPTPPDSKARKEGYATIADIGKERIRRIIKRMHKENKGHLIPSEREQPEDLGFKVFRLSESNYKHWKGIPEKTVEKYVEEMKVYIDTLVPGWKAENVIYEVMIKEGFPLTSVIQKETQYKDNEIWVIRDSNSERSFMICLDDKVKSSTIKNLRISKDDLFVCRDSALDDTAAANLALNCRLKTI